MKDDWQRQNDVVFVQFLTELKLVDIQLDIIYSNLQLQSKTLAGEWQGFLRPDKD